MSIITRTEYTTKGIMTIPSPKRNKFFVFIIYGFVKQRRKDIVSD